ncbi:MAG: AAA family ATPase [Clostridia bacterium]|nr:AAA family ATPase [Clostridia bacterium]
MAIRIVTASGKGGVGKSTVCKGLGLQFAKAGKKTLLIDCDAGLSSLDIMLGVADKVNFSWLDIEADRCEIADTLIEVTENLTLLPSPKFIEAQINDSIISEIVNNIDEIYDIIIMDAPAGIGTGLIRAAKGASKALVVATADEVSVKGAKAVDNVLKQHGIEDSRLLINRYDVKAARKGLLLTVDEIIDKTMVQLIGIIPEDKNIVYSTVSEKALRTKKSDNAFSRISQRIDGKNVELTLSQIK